MKSTKARVDKFDYAYPTVVRYAGLITTLVLIGFCLAGYALQAAPGFVPAGAMIIYKNLYNAAKDIDEDEEMT